MVKKQSKVPHSFYVAIVVIVAVVAIVFLVFNLRGTGKATLYLVKGAVGTVCTVNEQCASDWCYNGFCKAKLTDGQLCGVDSVCLSGGCSANGICKLSVGSFCASNKVCASNICSHAICAKLSQGSVCGSKYNCESGLSCKGIYGTCRRFPGDTSYAASERCVSEDNCLAGSYCDFTLYACI